MPNAIEHRLAKSGPKRILSLDGGGVRGLIALGILKRVETILAGRCADPQAFRLSDYFDLIGGTSTGAIVATLLAFGKSVDEIAKLYFEVCPEIFGRRSWLSHFYISCKFDAGAFGKTIDEIFDMLLSERGREDLATANSSQNGHPTLGSDLIQTGLAIITKRIDTSSVWVFTNNPRSKYWDPDSPHWSHLFAARGERFLPNRDYSLRRIVQASASAPYYLDAVDVEINPGRPGLFLDGGASPCNNPAQELFLMTTLKAYDGGGNGRGLSPFGFGWETGEHNLFVLSVGTGNWREEHNANAYKRQFAVRKAVDALQSIIADAEISGLAWMQALSETPGAVRINGNIEDLRGLRILHDPLLTFRRISPRLERDWLVNVLGRNFDYTPRELKLRHELDAPQPDNLQELHQIGIATGESLVDDFTFPAGFNI